MGSVRGLYRNIDDWAWRLSRGTYAIVSGLIAGFSVLAVSTVLGDPSYIFAVGIGLTLTVLYYWSNPNQKEE